MMSPGKAVSGSLPAAIPPKTVHSTREVLSHQCSLMIALSVLSFLFTYKVWWVSLFTTAVASIGYYASEMVKDVSAASTLAGDALGTALTDVCGEHSTTVLCRTVIPSRLDKAKVQATGLFG
ncbi:hypothetical protein DYB32_008238 [Aphanomyces invadans]|uniref:Uncharacterized protein n=1 Tax=Aphanomyces invadans TaxID=157072 RepID=A0A3R7A4K5_9STRA|nr:hypothetical protein DYB32_008238 [Aphanomyces invadans]